MPESYDDTYKDASEFLKIKLINSNVLRIVPNIVGTKSGDKNRVCN